MSPLAIHSNAFTANGWTPQLYAAFRAALGTYLFVHFAMLAPWAAELFSSAGMLGDAASSPLHGIFPNPLARWDGPWVAVGFVVIAGLASIALALGVRDRVAALFVWFVLACLFSRNPLIANPSLPLSVGCCSLTSACHRCPQRARRSQRLPGACRVRCLRSPGS